MPSTRSKITNLKPFLKYSLIAITLGVTVQAAQAQFNESESQTNTAIVRSIELEKADNFRDLAGGNGGYETQSGKKLKTGVIYRSNALMLTPQEIEKISDLNIRNI